MISIPEYIEVRRDLSLCKYSSFKIGGNADMAVFPKNSDELICTLKELKNSNIRYDIIGNGSNILFDDAGYRGALVFTHKINFVTYLDDNTIEVGCGKKITELASETLKKRRLAGLEFAYGIPGSVGGAVYMNAGAYGGEISNVLLESTCLDTVTGETVVLSAPEHEFSYRKSIFQDNKNLIIISSKIKLSPDDGSALERAEANMLSRREKQPLEYPNAGSTFKRPEGFIAAKMIDECGLKCTCIGGACVSEKHAGFFINAGGATSADILALADLVKSRVREKFGITLELEIIYIPEK